MADAETTEALAAAGDGGNGAEAQSSEQAGATEAKSGEWITGLPEPLRKRAETAKWGSPADAVQSYVDLERFASKSVQDMTPEERAKFHKKLGDRPESPDGYELSDIKLPDGLGYSNEQAQAFKAKMHELGVAKQQVKAIDEWAKNNALALIAEAKRQRSKVVDGYETTMRAEWGGDYDAFNNGVLEMAKKFGGDAFVQFVKGPGRNPVILRALKAVRDTMLEDTLETGGPVPPKTVPELVGGLAIDWSQVPEVSGDNRYGRG